MVLALLLNDPSKVISDLDRVVAAKHLQFRQFNGADVTVLGWPKKATLADVKQWIKDYSDHAVLCLEVKKV